MIKKFVTEQFIMLLCIAVLSVCLFTFSYIVWQWVSDWKLTHHQLATPTSSVVKDANHLLAAIPDAHLFGKSIGKGEVPLSNLQFVLNGIVNGTADGNVTETKAYISIDGQPSKIYLAGDELPYGVRISEITKDAVILENNGQYEKLLMQREQLEFKPLEMKENS